MALVKINVFNLGEVFFTKPGCSVVKQKLLCVIHVILFTWYEIKNLGEHHRSVVIPYFLSGVVQQNSF